MGSRKRKRRKSSAWKGMMAGLAGGLAGSWTMNEFQKLYARVAEGNGKQSQQRSGQEQASEDATMKAANRISQAVLDQELTRKQKEQMGPAIHYAFGTIMGGLYGTLAEWRHDVTAGFGTAFATMLFVAADEIAVPALRLSSSPQDVPLSSHIYALASHLVYGVAAEGVRRGVRTAL